MISWDDFIHTFLILRNRKSSKNNYAVVHGASFHVKNKLVHLALLKAALC